MTSNDRQATWPVKLMRGATGLYAVFAAASTAAISIAAVGGGIAWVASLSTGSGRSRVRVPLLLPIAAFLLGGAISAAFSPEPRVALLEAGSDWTPLFFVWVTATALASRVWLTRCIRLMAGASALAALFAIGEVFVHGIDYRVRGFLGHFNTLGSVLAIVALLTLAQVLFHYRGRRDAWLIAALAVLASALLLTQSRGAIGGFLLGAALLIAVRDRRFLLVVPLVGVLAVVAAPGGFKSRVLGILDLSDVTARERVYMWAAGAAMFRADPWTGVGPGLSRHRYDEFRRADDPWFQPDPPRHLHSNPVQLAAERGLVGLLPWVWLWLAFFGRAYDIYKRLPREDRDGRAAVLGSLAAGAAFALIGLADYTQADTEVALAIGFAMGLPFAVEEPEARGPAGTMAA